VYCTPLCPCSPLLATRYSMGFQPRIFEMIRFYHYIHDRVSGACQMPSLADLIEERAKVLNLGASWNTS